MDPHLEIPYWPVPNMNGNVSEYAFTIMKDNRIWEISNNIPNSEVTKLVNALPPGMMEGKPPLSIKANIALNRLINRICDHCLNKSDVENLKWCNKCKLTFYCSIACQRAKRDQHSKWCCQQDGPPDDGPQSTIILKENSK
jgi:hypothetical protein